MKVKSTLKDRIHIAKEYAQWIFPNDFSFLSLMLLPNMIKEAAHYLNHNRDLDLLEIMMRLTRRLNMGFLLSEEYDSYNSLHNTECLEWIRFLSCAFLQTW